MNDHFSQRSIFIIIIFLASLGQVCADLYLASLPQIGITFSITQNLVKLSMTYYLIGLSASQLVYGFVSDIHGRRKPLLFGLGLNVLGTLICIVAPTLAILNLGRLLEGLGAGASVILSRAALRDLFQGRRLAHYFSLLASTSVIFISGAPFIGGLIQHYFRWRINFCFLLAYVVLIFLCVIFFFPETHPIKRQGGSVKFDAYFSQAKAIFKKYSYWIHAFNIFSAYAAIISWLTECNTGKSISFHARKS